MLASQSQLAALGLPAGLSRQRGRETFHTAGTEVLGVVPSQDHKLESNYYFQTDIYIQQSMYVLIIRYQFVIHQDT